MGNHSEIPPKSGRIQPHSKFQQVSMMVVMVHGETSQFVYTGTYHRTATGPLLWKFRMTVILSLFYEGILKAVQGSHGKVFSGK
ncbi:unnamed protein product [Allacma fusca]|uniref:Uncharacterized protein n=1 Tax=Allacma fusca TaxID=39272 RepID=A0A8J2JBL3_9HEXA|nr:unnamed protein product [Allacma fusca]